MKNSKITTPIIPIESMTLRDYFAGQALIGIITRLSEKLWEGNVQIDEWSIEAGDAYQIADAMMECRAE